MNAAEYAMQVRNNASGILGQVTTYPDGTSRALPAEVTSGVLIAQANLAIAASIAELADALRSRS